MDECREIVKENKGLLVYKGFVFIRMIMQQIKWSLHSIWKGFVLEIFCLLAANTLYYRIWYYAWTKKDIFLLTYVTAIFLSENKIKKRWIESSVRLCLYYYKEHVHASTIPYQFWHQLILEQTISSLEAVHSTSKLIWMNTYIDQYLIDELEAEKALVRTIFLLTYSAAWTVKERRSFWQKWTSVKDFKCLCKTWAKWLWFERACLLSSSLVKNPDETCGLVVNQW